MANALRFLGVALIIVGIVSCKVYKPHWTPPDRVNYSENFDGTPIERFLKWSALGAIVFVIGSYIGARKQSPTARVAGLRRKGIILLFVALPLCFIPFNYVIPIGPICFLAGLILFILGLFSQHKGQSPKTEPTSPPSNSPSKLP